ncbi:MAG: Pr6Pr family membrane protein [Luteimonas sp.]
MQTPDRSRDRLAWLAALTCAVSLSALLLQYALVLRNPLEGVGPGYATVRFLSFFTILSNVLVVAVTAAALARSTAGAAGFFARADVRGAAALYIGVTGIIYATILRHLWEPQGALWWADSGLHYATPLLYLAWWIFGAGHGSLRMRAIASWLLFPLVYLVWTFARGAWVHEYPYPFLDVDALGWTTVLRNSVGVLVLFLVVGAVLIAIDKALRPRTG